MGNQGSRNWAPSQAGIVTTRMSTVKNVRRTRLEAERGWRYDEARAGGREELGQVGIPEAEGRTRKGVEGQGIAGFERQAGSAQSARAGDLGQRGCCMFLLRLPPKDAAPGLTGLRQFVPERPGPNRPYLGRLRDIAGRVRLGTFVACKTFARVGNRSGAAQHRDGLRPRHCRVSPRKPSRPGEVASRIGRLS